MAVLSTTSVLTGARDFNAEQGLVGIQDPGGKIAILISGFNALVSAVSALNVAVSALNVAAVSAATSAVTFSAFSTAPTSTILLNSYTGTLSNWTA